ncbi:hypothetical protein AB0L13_45315 [Saccharopolyspora shandongensis]|uniref:hypothetical protein n=1 Tax=Saccharopolyspora shandongensis TaxID=418495 RepID=UPI00342CF1F7
MSIDDQARNRWSRLSRFLDAHLSHRGYIEDAWGELVEAAPGPECGSLERWDDIGRALELRIGLDLGQRPEPWPLLTYLPPERYSELLAAAGFEPRHADGLPSSGTSDPVLLDWRAATRPQSPDDRVEHRALATCLDLMEVERQAHKRPRRAVDQRRSWFAVITEDGSLGGDPEARDALGKAWAQYVEQGRAAFQALGDHVLVAPELAGGFGIADFVVGHTLVDVKLTRKPKPPVDRWLRQLLGYLLLDWDNALRLETLAVYAGWQGRMLTCSVDQLLEAASSGPTPSLTSLRDKFRSVLRNDFDSFTTWKHRQPHSR